MCYKSYKIAKILYQYYIYTAGPFHFFCRIPRTYSHSTILFSLGKLHTVPPPHGFLLQPSPSLGEFRDGLLPFRTFLMHELLLNVYIFQSLMSTASDSGAALITPSTMVVSHGMHNMLSQEGICYSNSLLDLHRHRHWQKCYIIMGSDISLDGFSSCSHIEPVISVHVPCLRCVISTI